MCIRDRLAAIKAVNATFQEAAAMGVRIMVSAGDHGSDCGMGDRKAHVLYPGSDPFVTSCGGTSLSDISGVNFTEHVWNDNDNDWLTGGGVSDVFFPRTFPSPLGKVQPKFRVRPMTGTRRARFPISLAMPTALAATRCSRTAKT